MEPKGAEAKPAASEAQREGRARADAAGLPGREGGGAFAEDGGAGRARRQEAGPGKGDREGFSITCRGLKVDGQVGVCRGLRICRLLLFAFRLAR